VWLREAKHEDLKVLRLYLCGIALAQLVLWTDEKVECGVPISAWLLLFSVLMLADVAVRVRKINIINGYVHSLRELPEVGETIDEAITVLKANAQICYATEVMQVLCLIYGLKVFYSEDNRCNWEGKHSIGYVVMFMDLTLGMILVFKWFLKLAEMLVILLSAAAIKLNSILRRRPGVNLREPLMMRLRQPL